MIVQDEKLDNVASELAEIFKYLEPGLLEKIPAHIVEQINKRRNPNYKFKLDKTKDLNEQDLMEETRQVLSAIFVEYCCTEQEAEELLEQHKIRQLKKEEDKVGLEELQNIFNSKLKDVKYEEVVNNIALVEDARWYTKIINKIKVFFKMKK